MTNACGSRCDAARTKNEPTESEILFFNKRRRIEKLKYCSWIFFPSYFAPALRVGVRARQNKQLCAQHIIIFSRGADSQCFPFVATCSVRGVPPSRRAQRPGKWRKYENSWRSTSLIPHSSLLSFCHLSLHQTALCVRRTAYRTQLQFYIVVIDLCSSARRTSFAAFYNFIVSLLLVLCFRYIHINKQHVLFRHLK